MTEPSRASSRRRILGLTASAAGVAALIFVGAILPAEFNRDPLGIGKATGISALWALEEVHVAANASAAAPARSETAELRTIEVDIPLGPGGDPAGKDQLEYKVRLHKGASFVYSWHVEGAKLADEFYSEFHGHTLGNGKTMTVAEYRKESGISDKGTLTAPLDGIHGWYFLNTAEGPVRVKLRMTGFFDVIPPGEPGNEAGIAAKIS